MAIAEAHLAATFGNDVVDHRTYVLASDGDLMEGISQEAIALAGHLKLNKLIVLFDDNGISIDGPLSLADSVDQVKRFEAAGWNASRIDGHDPDAIAAALEAAQTSDRPIMIACRTTIGFGAPTKAGKASSHGSPLGADEIAGARKALGWSEAPFEVPADVLELWRTAGKRGQAAHAAWSQRLQALAADKRADFERRLAGKLPAALGAAVLSVKKTLAATPKEIASRIASEQALEAITAAVPEMIGGSADLTGSNNTRTKAMKAMSASDYAGALHPLRRARARHGRRHERHGAARRHHPLFRHVPGVRRLLPAGDPACRADGAARHPCDDARLHRARRRRADPPAGRACRVAARDPEPAGVPPLRRGRDRGMLAACARSARPPERAGADAPEPAAAAPRDGREQPLRRRRLRDRPGRRAARRCRCSRPVPRSSIAVEARKLLSERGVLARVVSVPCFELLMEAPERTRRAVIGSAPVNVAVEAGIRQGWDAIIGSDGAFVGMTGIRRQRAVKDLYKHFGITPQAVADAALSKL